MWRLGIIVLLAFLFSCNQKRKPSETLIHDSLTVSISKPQRPTYKQISEVSETGDILKYWAAQYSYYPTLHFRKDTLDILFNGQCQYSFPYKTDSNTIIVYWDFIEDCTHDIGIRISYDSKNSPIIGKPFMTIYLLNDTTIQASYKHPEWVERLNKEYLGYKYFPERFFSR